MVAYKNESKACGVWKYDIVTGNIDIDQALCDMVGFDQTSANLDDVKRFFFPESITEIAECITEYRDNERTFCLDLRARNGQWYELYGKMNTIEGAFIGELVDISEKKNLVDQKIQDEKLKSLSYIAGGIAHDFNNYLMGISGGVDMLKKYVDDTNAKPYFRIIESAIGSIQDLIKKLSMFSRMNRKNEEKFSVLNLISDIREQCKKMKKCNIDLKISEFCSKLIIMGNQEMIKNAVFNLLQNAVDITDANDSIEIRISYEFLDKLPHNSVTAVKIEQGFYVRIDVEDYGNGIHEDIRGRIFDPFFTTKGFANGTGLGLSVVLCTVQQHQGILTVRSEEGKGSVFSMYLKLSDDNQMLSEQKGIMVIDDEEMVRLVVSEILYEEKYNPLCFERGSVAIDFYRKNFSKIKMVIVDMIMPGMSGIDVIKELVQINPNVKIMILSGYSDTDVNNQLSKNIDYIFVAKPIDANTLIRQVNYLLCNRKLIYNREKALNNVGGNEELLSVLIDCYYELCHVNYLDLYHNDYNQYIEKIKSLKGIISLLGINEILSFIDKYLNGQDGMVNFISKLMIMLKKSITYSNEKNYLQMNVM